jgi:GNAT superfamily N-acetyltransferase
MTISFRTELPPTEQFSDLFQTTGWNEEYQLSPAELGRSLQNSWYAVAAYEGKRLVGFGRIVSDGVMYAMIHDMIVAPDFQQQGIGTRILEMLVSKCLEANVRAIQLFSARGKREYYEHHGFVVRPHDAPGMQYHRVPGAAA